MSLLRDIKFTQFNWERLPNGDLAAVQELDSFRDLLIRWLLTTPAETIIGQTNEEIEVRRLHLDEQARASAYDPPRGEMQLACMPWEPTWGAGIKRYQNLPMTKALVVEVQGHIRAGISRLEGVEEVISLGVSAIGHQLTISARLRTEFGILNMTATV